MGDTHLTTLECSILQPRRQYHPLFPAFQCQSAHMSNLIVFRALLLSSGGADTSITVCSIDAHRYGGKRIDDAVSLCRRPCSKLLACVNLRIGAGAITGLPERYHHGCLKAITFACKPRNTAAYCVHGHQSTACASYQQQLQCHTHQIPSADYSHWVEHRTNSVRHCFAFWCWDPCRTLLHKVAK